MLTRLSRGVLTGAAFVIAATAMPGVAHAVLSGTNGRIVFASGRGAADDSNAKLYLRLTSGSFGGSPTTEPPLDTTAGQHRHPTWSPDRTMIAYARGGPSCTPDCDIFTLDLTTPGASPVNITNTADINEDRPAWSPDGARIAFESEVTNGSGQLDVLVDTEPLGTSGNLNLTNTPTAGQFEGKPAWSPDSQTLYYARGNVNVAPGVNEADSANIYREPADSSGSPALAVANVSAAHHFQPSISPDGNRICYTLSTTAGLNTSATVMVGDLTSPPTAGTVLGNDPTGNYNCTWSPDGTQVAYVQGTFGAGNLVMKNLDDPLLPIPLEESVRFDGNPDWAPDARPRCEDTTVNTPVNTPVSIPLECEDTGPEYERTAVRALPTDPSNGTLPPDLVAQEVPANVTYTPNPGFIGTDTFEVTSFDEVAFGDRRGTVTVNVKAPNDFSFGKTKKNKKKGTAKLTVNVPGAGDLELAKSNKVKGAAKRADSEGSVKLKVKPKGKAKDKLADKGEVKVKAEVTFSPDGGDPNTKTKKVKLKLR